MAVTFIYNTVNCWVQEPCMLCEQMIPTDTYVRDWETKLLFCDQFCWHFFSVAYQEAKEKSDAKIPKEDFYR